MRAARERELAMVASRGIQIDGELSSKCAYYPLFRFIDFIDEKTGDRVRGQMLVCKKCSIAEPNKRCKRHTILLW